MMDLTVFNYQDKQIRTHAVNNEPYFCLRDVCSALGLKNSKDRTFDKGVETFYLPTKSGNQNITFINEPNLYRLIFRSNKPQAQAFADWVYSEVLPSIRRTGGYGVPAVCEGLSEDDRKAIGGIVKRCVGVAVKEQLEGMVITKTVDALSDFNFPEWGQGLEIQPRDIREGLRSLIAQIGFRMDYRDTGYSSLMKLYQFNKVVLALFERYDTIRTENLLAIDLMDGNRLYDKKKVLQCFKYLNKKLPTLSVCVGR
jgi:hypothetical protein